MGVLAAKRLSMLCVLLLLAAITPLSFSCYSFAGHEHIEDLNRLLAEADNTTSSMLHRGGGALNTCGCASVTASDRIVGGHEVSPKYSLPYQAYIYNFMMSLWCGGTIINRRYVLTAGHCLYYTEDGVYQRFPVWYFQVVVGEHNTCDGFYNEGGPNLSVERIIEQPDYNPNFNKNDIALLKLKTDIRFGANVKPACLPTNPNKSYAGQRAIVSGWGSTITWGGNANDYSCKLMRANLIIISKRDRRCAYVTKNDSTTRLCAFKKGKDTCQGDSGGPLVVSQGGKYVLVGVTSHGIGCAGMYPGVYTRVTHYLDWIADNIKDGN